MGFLRRHPILVSSVALALIPVFLVVASGIAVWQSAHTDDARRVDRADAILVLGAAQYGGRPSPVFIGRLQQGALLYRNGRSSRILVLGGGQPGDHTTEAEAGRDYLVEQGVPDDAVVPIPEGDTTYESLRAAAEYFDANAIDTAFLVSDPWHNLRIKRMAGDLGITPYASATWTSAARSQGTRLSGYIRETFAYIYYRVFGA